MKRRMLELVAVTAVVFVLHLAASIAASMWAYVDYNSGTARILWSVLRFPEDTPEVLPDGYRQLLKPHWPEMGGLTMTLNSGLWAITIATLVVVVNNRLDRRRAKSANCRNCG